jgi:hypothetical protein
MTYDSFRFNDMTQGVLAVPLWIPQSGYSGGLVILLIAFVDELFHDPAAERRAARRAPQDRRAAHRRMGQEGGGGRAGGDRGVSEAVRGAGSPHGTEMRGPASPRRAAGPGLRSDVPCQARRCNIPASPRFSREVIDAMIVQRWGRSLETSVIKL